MPDMTLCTRCNNKCPRKNECFRYKAKPDLYYQSYFYPLEDGDKCEYFTKHKI